MLSSKFFAFWIAYVVTGSPLAAVLVVLALWLFADWQTFGFARRALRALRDLQRQGQLSRVVLLNPHDRKARVDLGEILVRQRRFQKAMETLKPALENDPGDEAALFWMGLSCLGAGRIAEGELFLQTVAGVAASTLRELAVLELGRGRLQRRDGAGAQGFLEELLGRTPSHVEGRYLLSQALDLQGDGAGARRERDRVWAEYRSSPGYRRRSERLWAWRARPHRPIAYAIVLAATLAAIGTAVRRADPRPPRGMPTAVDGDDG
jgi:tetratricopeptide (TPR) repeat protein